MLFARSRPARSLRVFSRRVAVRSRSGLLPGIQESIAEVAQCAIQAEDLTLATVFLGAMVGMLVMGRAALVEHARKHEGCDMMRQWSPGLGDMVGRARAMQVQWARMWGRFDFAAYLSMWPVLYGVV